MRIKITNELGIFWYWSSTSNILVNQNGMTIGSYASLLAVLGYLKNQNQGEAFTVESALEEEIEMITLRQISIYAGTLRQEVVNYINARKDGDTDAMAIAKLAAKDAYLLLKAEIETLT